MLTTSVKPLKPLDQRFDSVMFSKFSYGLPRHIDKFSRYSGMFMILGLFPPTDAVMPMAGATT